MIFKKWVPFHRILLFIYIAIYIGVLNSCKLINPDQQIPSYISIDKISFKTNISGDTDSQDITDAWVYVDDQKIGAFELPAKFPVLITGSNHRVQIRPGIKLNGISATRASYDMYVNYDTIMDLPIGKTVKIKPRTTYKKNVNSHLLFENFEEVTNLQFIKTARSYTDIKPVRYDSMPAEDLNVFGKQYAGLIELNSVNSFFEIVTDTSYVLPGGSIPVYLELDYKTNNTFTITMEINSSGGKTLDEVITINPTATWKKIYVNLTPFTNAIPYVYNYKIYIDQWLNTGVSQGIILLDNIKLLTTS